MPSAVPLMPLVRLDGRADAATAARARPWSKLSPLPLLLRRRLVARLMTTLVAFASEAGYTVTGGTLAKGMRGAAMKRGPASRVRAMHKGRSWLWSPADGGGGAEAVADSNLHRQVPDRREVGLGRHRPLVGESTI